MAARHPGPSRRQLFVLQDNHGGPAYATFVGGKNVLVTPVARGDTGPNTMKMHFWNELSPHPTPPRRLPDGWFKHLQMAFIWWCRPAGPRRGVTLCGYIYKPQCNSASPPPSPPPLEPPLLLHRPPGGKITAGWQSLRAFLLWVFLAAQEAHSSFALRGI